MKSGGRKLGDGRSTPEARARARVRIAAVNRKRHRFAICGATCRTSGDPCRNFAMENGRCYLHGGRTPRGKDWHRPIGPNKNAPDAIAKLNRKLVDLEKRAKKRARRLAKRSPEVVAAYYEWQKTHRPGDPKARASERERRRRDQEAAKLISGMEAARDRFAGDVALAEAIAESEARLKSVRREIEIAENWDKGTGVFG